jgi:hypothetical protein
MLRLPCFYFIKTVIKKIIENVLCVHLFFWDTELLCRGISPRDYKMVPGPLLHSNDILFDVLTEKWYPRAQRLRAAGDRFCSRCFKT